MSIDKQKPQFVFVDNTTERMLTLRRSTAATDHPKGQPPPQESTMLGRGLNYVRADYVAANPRMSMLGAVLVDPTKIPENEVKAKLHRCTSRQAMIEWGRLEKRGPVLSAIKAWLNKSTPAADVDNEMPSE